MILEPLTEFDALQPELATAELHRAFDQNHFVSGRVCDVIAEVLRRARSGIAARYGPFQDISALTHFWSSDFQFHVGNILRGAMIGFESARG